MCNLNMASVDSHPENQLAQCMVDHTGQIVHTDHLSWNSIALLCIMSEEQRHLLEHAYGRPWHGAYQSLVAWHLPSAA